MVLDSGPAASWRPGMTGTQVHSRCAVHNRSPSQISPTTYDGTPRRRDAWVWSSRIHTAGEGRAPKPWRQPLTAARRHAGLALPEGVIAATDRLSRGAADWTAAELAPGRLMPWLPVAFGFGIVLYFTAGREPALWAALAAAAFGVALTVWARRSVVGLPLALGFAAIACGFAAATLQTARLAHPVLAYPTWRAQVTGFVEAREERARSDRIVVRVCDDLGAAHAREARARARCRAQRDCAGGRPFRCLQGASVAAAAAAASRRLRLCPRHVLPEDRCLRLCAGPHQDIAAAACAEFDVALRRLARRSFAKPSTSAST